MSIFFCPIRFQRRFGPQSSTRSSCSSDIYHTHTCIQQSFNNTSLILTRQWKKMPWRQWNVTCQHTIYNLYLWHTAGWFKHIKQSFAPEQQRLKWVGLSSRVFYCLEGTGWLYQHSQTTAFSQGCCLTELCKQETALCLCRANYIPLFSKFLED